MVAGKVLVVDDDEKITTLLRAYLSKEGFEVDVAANGEDALRKVPQFQPDVLVLDIMLPGIDGIEVLRRVRQESPTYVVLLTAKADETDKVIGLTVGADDHVTKPFSARELTARIRAIFRRMRGQDEGISSPLTFRTLRINPARREVWRGHSSVSLTALEFDLLYALAAHPGRVLTREQLLARVWGADFFGDARVVDAHIKELRRKLGDHAAHARLLQTVRGVGYRFADEPS